MRRTALLGIAALLACAFVSARFKVEPGPVVVKQGVASASFRLIAASDGHPEALMPDGKPGVTGGGCLIFQDAREPVSCTRQNLECDSRKPSVANGAYCDVAVSTGAGTCWFRPTSDPCYRSKMDRLEYDKPHALTTESAPLPPPAKVRWRVLTCQGLVAGGCGKPGKVEDVDFRMRWGPVTEP